MQADDIRQQLDRVLQSPQFRSARNRASFLRYVVVKTLAGEGERLKEYTIGVEVFERGEAFNPKTDGVVRVQAGLLRKHLEAYYADGGRDDPIRIVIPKGHYVPQFHEPALAANGRSANRLVRGARALGTRTWLYGVGTALMVFVTLVSVAMFRGWGTKAVPPLEPMESSRSGVAAGDPAYAPLWARFLDADVATVLAFGIPQFFSGGDIWLRDVTVNGLAPGAGSQLKAIERALSVPLRPNEAYTGIGEAYGVYLISRFYLENGRDIRLARSHSISWDNLKHDNVIFLTSARFSTLADQLTYPSDFVYVLEPGRPNRIVNRRPEPGERPEYVARLGQDVEVDYAVITLWPGKLPDRRILILSGSTTWGTQAAAEYVTEPGYQRELSRRLGDCQRRANLAAHPEFFQVLLRVEIRDRRPVTITYVTHHDFSTANGRGTHDTTTSSQPAGRPRSTR
ncbi:MAG: hypothetical protein GEU99_20150 [Luteitalea sp.]|nr:hypothetical protein [Luteitalea sp.]